ncbi:TPA: hypothetical protein N0F65_012792 [Lagenidium giganteum]|uniref:OTU domain-containing protein n=1 Tax=Lagenidium giganteum TaxID=4803 RepID=A0AAV2YGL1_9STRA|nr:TPA: hypothetical protein N0F65_012792 [Lagenidium giganteum]
MTMEGEEYVFVVNATGDDAVCKPKKEERPVLEREGSASWHHVDEAEGADHSLEVEEVPPTLPFLPALDASTEITKFDGYSEAINDAQSCIDSRLLAYSQYQLIAPADQQLLTPRRRQVACPQPTIVLDRPVTVCMGWQRVSGVSSSDREVLRLLEEDGVSYSPHDTAYSVKYLAPVAPYGDCLFLSVEQLLLYTEECEPLPPHKIRRLATKFFLAHYRSKSPDERQRIDTTIRNLYCPSLSGGWRVSPMQTRRFVALRKDKNLLLAKCVELQERGYSWSKAAEMVYSQYAQPVVNAEAYCDYMAVGNGDNTHFLIALNYSQRGLMSVDNDADNSRVAWGDDIVLEALATAYQREIFVVLVGCGKMFFLPHSPRPLSGDVKESLQGRSKGHAPWFILMRNTGADRGGDHYEPMLCERLRGDGSSEFGNIGD